MTTVYFVRHGEFENTKGIVPMRLPGFHLNAAGREGIWRLSEDFLRLNIKAIYTSPVERCRETAEIIGERLGVVPIVDGRLIELLSPFQGMNKVEFERMTGGKSLYQFSGQLENGEKPEEVAERMESFLQEILEKFADQSVVAVSHGDPIMILEAKLAGKDLYQVGEGSGDYIPRGGYFEFRFEGRKFLGEVLVGEP